MNVTSFLKQTVVNPNTSEESERLAVKFDNGRVIKLYPGKDTGIKDIEKEILADRELAIKKVVVLDGEYGPYCMLSRAKTTKEF